MENNFFIVSMAHMSEGHFELMKYYIPRRTTPVGRDSIDSLIW